jgi:hypothetical protein
MKVALVFATDGSEREDAIIAPFRSPAFIAGLRRGGIDPILIALTPDEPAAACACARNRDPVAPPWLVALCTEPGSGKAPVPTGDSVSDAVQFCQRSALRGLLVRENPDVVQTFGAEYPAASVWGAVRHLDALLVHCVANRFPGVEAPEAAIAMPPSARTAPIAWRARRASRRVDAVLGTGRAAVGSLIGRGYFPRAVFSAMTAPPVGVTTAAARTALAGGVPVFGVYDPPAAMVPFVADAVRLSGCVPPLSVRIAVREPLKSDVGSMTLVAANGLDSFLSTIDVLAVPAYDDSYAAAIIAALRNGKRVLVPEGSGGAELIEHGRHGLVFAQNAYHFANAMALLEQSWRQKPPLMPEGSAAIALTDPAAVAETVIAVYDRLAQDRVADGRGVDDQGARRASLRAPMGGAGDRPEQRALRGDAAEKRVLRYGVVALARFDSRLTDATVQAMAQLAPSANAAVLAVPRGRQHQFESLASSPFPGSLRLTVAPAADAIAAGFRSLAAEADIVVFVPEGVVLDPDYLERLGNKAERWPDLVGEIDLLDRTVDLQHPAGADPHAQRNWRPWRALRAMTLRDAVLWVRVEACANLQFPASPQNSDYLGFAALLDQLRQRGRTRLVSSDAALRRRWGPERRSGYEAGRELYAALYRIREAREHSDVAFAGRSHYLDPNLEILRLFGEQALRFVTVPALRSYTGSFIKGLWTARREARMTRRRVHEEIRKLG